MNSVLRTLVGRHSAVTDEGRMPAPAEPRAWGGFLALPENRSALRAVRLVAKAVRAGRRPPFGPLVLHGPPGTAGRRVILAAAASARKVRLSPDALDWLAGQANGVRPLLGLLNNLAQLAPAYPGPLDRTAAAELLAGTGQPTSARRDVPGIV